MYSRRNSMIDTFAKFNKFLRSTAIFLNSGSIPYSAFILYMNCSRGLLYRFTTRFHWLVSVNTVCLYPGLVSPVELALRNEIFECLKEWAAELWKQEWTQGCC